MNTDKYTLILLRVGIAFAFLYPPIAAFFDPFSWIGFFPAFVRDLFGNDALLLNVFGLSEIAIGLWILSGKKIFIPSILASLYLFLIVIFNWASLAILFRDISILFMAIALVLLSRQNSAEGPSQQG